MLSVSLKKKTKKKPTAELRRHNALQRLGYIAELFTELTDTYMTTDEIAEKLGYYDTKHLEDNIANYGEPLDTWWAVIKNLVNNYDIIPHVSNCVKCGEREGKGKTKQCDTCLMDGIV